MPEYLMFIVDDEKEREAVPEAEFQAAYAKVRAWWDEHEKAGHFIPNAGRRLDTSTTATTVRVADGGVSVTDGPFLESKELVGGFGILDVPDMESAVEIAKSWPGLPVALELRPVRVS